MSKRAEYRRLAKATEKESAKRFYTEKEFNRAVDAKVERIRAALERKKAEDYMPDVMKHLDKEWNDRLDEHTIQAWALFVNSAIWVLHKEFGFGEVRAGRFADKVAEVYNNEPDLAKMQEDILKELGLQVGFK